MNWRQRIDKWLAVSVRRRLLDGDLAAIQPHLRGRVLEIGAGRSSRRGDFRPPQTPDLTWLCMDVSRAGRPDLQADAMQLPFAVQAFDTLVCLEVLEYVADPGLALRQMRRVLSPTACLVLSVPFMHRQDTPHDFWRFTQAGIQRLLGQNGFEVVEVRQQGSAPAVAANILKYWLHLHPRRLWRARFARPFVQWLWARDAQAAESIPQLGSFSTGYLIIARPSA